MVSNLPTKYRPKTFSEVVYQEIPKSVLTKIALSPGISVRSICLKGSYGSGKTTLAKLFAKALNCTEFHSTHDVCNSCANCHESSIPNSQTYWEFDSTVIGSIDNIRSLREKLNVLPPNNQRRLIVFDECHALSKAALNGLLKLIEEGVPQTIFMFCTTESILPTIASRSVCLDITTIPPSYMSPRIEQVASEENITITPEQVTQICLKSEGHMRNALSLLQLFHLGGPVVLKTPLKEVSSLFACALTNKHTESLLQSILLYPTTDIVNALSVFIKACFTATPESPYYKFLKSNVIYKIFNFFYSPVAQQALKSEVGTELLFRNFITKCNGV